MAASVHSKRTLVNAISMLRRFRTMPTSSQNVLSASASPSVKGCAPGTLLMACCAHAGAIVGSSISVTYDAWTCHHQVQYLHHCKHGTSWIRPHRHCQDALGCVSGRHIHVGVEAFIHGRVRHVDRDTIESHKAGDALADRNAGAASVLVVAQCMPIRLNGTGQHVGHCNQLHAPLTQRSTARA